MKPTFSPPPSSSVFCDLIPLRADADSACNVAYSTGAGAAVAGTDSTGAAAGGAAAGGTDATGSVTTVGLSCQRPIR
jgi:hypothetical protein